MLVRLSNNTVSKIASLRNSTNAVLISEFYQQYMNNKNGASESHQNNSLKLI
jgi:hypothetical protein